MARSICISKTVFNAPLESSFTLNTAEFILSQTFQNFYSEATSCSSFFGIGCGKILAPLVRLHSEQFFTYALGSGQTSKLFSYYASFAFSLTVEGTGMHVGTQIIRDGKIEEGAFIGSLNSTLTIIACKAAGKIVPPNVILLNLAQDGAMVGMSEITCQFGLSEKTNESTCEKLLHAQVNALQMECSANLAGIMISQTRSIHAACELSYKTQIDEVNPLGVIERVKSFRKSLNTFFPSSVLVLEKALGNKILFSEQDQSLQLNQTRLLERRNRFDSNEKTNSSCREGTEKNEPKNLKPPLSILNWFGTARTYLINNSLHFITTTDLLIAGAVTLSGCEGEKGGMIGGILYLIGNGAKRILRRQTPQLSEHPNQSLKSMDGSKIFGPAIYELADFLNTRDVHHEQLDPYLIATHERHDQLLATIQEVFPEITQANRQSLFLADLLKTPLLLSKTHQDFAKMLDILLQRTSELRSKLTPHLPPAESQAARRGETPDNLSGVWIDIMTAVLKEALPSKLSSLSTNRKYRATPLEIDSQASTPEGNPLDHLLISIGDGDPIDGRAAPSRQSSTNLPNRKRSDSSIGSAYTHLIPVDPSAQTPLIDHVFLPGDGTVVTHVIVFHKADIIPHKMILLETFPREMPLEEPLSLGMNRSTMSAPMLMAETGLLIPDLIRLEGEPPTLTEGTPTPIIEVLNLTEGVPEAFRMETYQARHEETRIAKLFPTITSSKIRRIVRRAFYRARDKFLGTVETAPVSRPDLKSFLYSESPPPADKTIGSLSITPEWMRAHDQSLHFLHKGNHRSLLRSLAYELACQNDPYFNPNESHTAELLYTGVTIKRSDFLDFYRIQTRLGAFILIYNLEGEVLFQMHYTRPDSSTSPILSTHSAIAHEFAASQTTEIPGARGFGVSGDTIIELEESRETLPGSRKSLNKKGGEKK